jgi:hypothetical protein
MSYYLSARWDRRPETTESCAQRFGLMLEELSAVNPALANWRQQASTRAAAYRPFCTMPPQLEELKIIFEQGRHFKSVTGELTPELGYSVAAWNGCGEPESLSLRLSAGNYYYRRLYPNEVCLGGIRPESRLVDANLLKDALLTIAKCWDADWGVVETWGYERLAVDEADKPLLPYGGWLTYLSSPLAEKMSPPPGVHAERTSDDGLFMLVSDEPFDATNPTHIARLDTVQKSLAPIQLTLGSAFNAPPPIGA